MSYHNDPERNINDRDDDDFNILCCARIIYFSRATSILVFEAASPTRLFSSENVKCFYLSVGFVPNLFSILNERFSVSD